VTSQPATGIPPGAAGDGDSDAASHARAAKDLGSPRPLVGDEPSARQRLESTVVAYWRWRIAFAVLPALVLLAGVAWVLPIGVPGVSWVIVAVVVGAVAVGIVVLPPIRYRVFWFAVSPSEIDIQHGIVFVKRSVVPLERVQSLRTERGPISDRYGLANLHIRTAGGAVSITGLRQPDADALCTRISRLTELADNI
jgi:uncharacterized protein